MSVIACVYRQPNQFNSTWYYYRAVVFVATHWATTSRPQKVNNLTIGPSSTRLQKCVYNKMLEEYAPIMNEWEENEKEDETDADDEKLQLCVCALKDRLKIEK